MVCIRGAAGRQGIISRAVGRSRHTSNGSDHETGTERVIAPAVPAATAAAAPVAIAVADVDVTGVDISVVDVVAATTARPIARPSSTANAAHTSDASDTSGTADTSDAAWAS